MTTLGFLTWNLALMKRSAAAPHSWGTEHSESAFRDTVLDLSPDIILLQELPGLVPFVETHAMIRANPKSHSGHLATLVKHELVSDEPHVNVVAGCAILTTFDDLTVANVHLAPGTGKRAEAVRLEQFARIVEASPTPGILVVGDTNTRIGELSTLESAQLHAPPLPSPTWDSRINQFNSGRSATEFRAYFTRCFTSPGVTVSDLAVLDTPIEFDGHRFHLSDHFGLAGRVNTKRV
ncbi:MAG: endonuclease/exonuclease/phosphatase family protein [Acidimicrobiales bacterium]